MSQFCLPHASESYKSHREALLEAEIALKHQREAVAAMRRSLPTDTPVTQDYRLTMMEGSPGAARGTRTLGLADLFVEPEKPLVLIHFMWRPEQENPCPMCTMWADGYDRAAPHVRARANLAVMALKDVESFNTFAQSRGWRNLPFVSCAGTFFNADFGMQDAQGNQRPGVSVFVRRPDGVFHTYSTTAMIGEDRARGLDLLNPVWHLFDLLPNGRGDYFPAL